MALLIDGVHLGDHCLIVALGIAADGAKHALGLWDGATENATVCKGLLANLQSRGLRTWRGPTLRRVCSVGATDRVVVNLAAAGFPQREGHPLLLAW